MAEPAAPQRRRISALLNKLPSEAAFRFVQALGLFAPLFPLIDAANSPKTSVGHQGTGRVSSQSLPAVWKWLSETAAVGESDALIEKLASVSVGGRAQTDADIVAVGELRDALGRAALAVLDGGSPEDLATALGAPGLVLDARLVAEAFTISGDLHRLKAVEIPPDGSLPEDVTELAREVMTREPDRAGVFACAVVGLTARTADAVPFLLALARERDQHRLNISVFALALSAVIEVACTRGASALEDEDCTPAAALAAIEARARDILDLSAALRGHVTETWTRRLNLRIGEIGRSLDGLCRVYSAKVQEALREPERGADPFDAEDYAEAAEFLVRSQSIATTLRFEVARGQALNDAVRELGERAGDIAEDRLRTLAHDAPEKAAACVELRGRLIGLLQDDAAARAWARRGRRILGRPAFEERVLAVVEPILVEEAATPLRGGHIASELVEALWTWAAAGPLADVIGPAATAFEAERDNDEVAAERVVVRFRAVLTKAIRMAADPDQGFRPQVRGDVGAQLSAIAALLSGAEVIESRLVEWPLHVKHVGEEHVAAVRALHDELTESWPEVEPSLLILVMSRLERPWQVLRMLERIARTNSDVLVEASEFVSIGDILIDRAEADAAHFRLNPGVPFHADRVLAALERFAGIASGMTEEFQIRRHGAWGGRLYALKAHAAGDLEGLCQAAVAAMDKITPRVVEARGRWRPDVDQMIEEADLAIAAQFGRFLRGSSVLDNRAAFAGARSAAVTQMEGRLMSQLEALLASAHAGEQRAEALAQFRSLANVVTEFMGEELSTSLLRRAAAA